MLHITAIFFTHHLELGSFINISPNVKSLLKNNKLNRHHQLLNVLNNDYKERKLEML